MGMLGGKCLRPCSSIAIKSTTSVGGIVGLCVYVDGVVDGTHVGDDVGPAEGPDSHAPAGTTTRREEPAGLSHSSTHVAPPAVKR